MRCQTPFMLKHEGKNLPCPCGRCPACYLRRAVQWSFRLVEEDKISTTAYFVTLTYDTQNVPISPNGFLTLHKKDLQKFIKRLRHTTNEKIKYYAVGEYGGKTSRPHYHLILFNATPDGIYKSWRMGHIHFGSVTQASIGYTLKYISKNPKRKTFERDDRVKEWSVMSKGIGKSYITENSIKWHRNDLENRMLVVSLDGFKLSMPRYYRNKIYTEQEKELIFSHMEEVEIKERRKEAQKAANTPRYYEDKDANQQAAFKRLQKLSEKNCKI